MLIATNTEERVRVDAEKSRKDQGPFFCPACDGEVILKRGTEKIPHFAHKPDSNCSYGYGESEDHLLAKRLIYNELYFNSPVFKTLELECSLGEFIPDVYIEYSDGLKIAFELQRSNRTPEYMEEKTYFYSRSNIHTLWLVVTNWYHFSHGEEVNLSEWEKWLHSIYYGRVYYIDPSRGPDILAVHYDPVISASGGYLKNRKRPRFSLPMRLRRGDFTRHNKGRASQYNPFDNMLIIKDRFPRWW